MRDPLVGVVVLVAAVGHAVPGHVHGALGPQRPGEHPHDRHPADVGVDGGAHDLGDQRALGVGGQPGAGEAVEADHVGQRVLQRRRERADDAVQQLGQAHAGRRAHRQHRVERAARHGRLQVRDQRRLVDLLAVEVALHERLVLALGDDPLDQLGPFGRVALQDGGVAGDQPDQPVAARHVQGNHTGAESVLTGDDRVADVGAVVVGPGDHDRARHPDGGALRPQRGGGGVEALEGVDDEQGGVGGPQTRAQFPDEVGVTGGVDEVDLEVAVPQRGDGEADRALLAHGGGVVVAHGRALGDRPGPRDDAARGEQRLRQRGLARPRGADQHDVADLGRVVHSDRACRVAVVVVLGSHGSALHDPRTSTVAGV